MTQQSQAVLRHLRVAPRKVRLVAEQVRGLPIQQALDLLAFIRKSAARDMLKLFRSAVANANQKGGIDLDNLSQLSPTYGVGYLHKSLKQMILALLSKICVSGS